MSRVEGWRSCERSDGTEGGGPLCREAARKMVVSRRKGAVLHLASSVAERWWPQEGWKTRGWELRASGMSEVGCVSCVGRTWTASFSRPILQSFGAPLSPFPLFLHFHEGMETFGRDYADGFLVLCLRNVVLVCETIVTIRLIASRIHISLWAPVAIKCFQAEKPRQIDCSISSETRPRATHTIIR